MGLSKVSGSGIDANVITPANLHSTFVLPVSKLATGSGSGLDADTLDGEHGAYYLDYTNSTNKPTLQDITNSGSSTTQGATFGQTVNGTQFSGSLSFQLTRANGAQVTMGGSNTYAIWAKNETFVLKHDGSAVFGGGLVNLAANGGVSLGSAGTANGVNLSLIAGTSPAASLYTLLQGYQSDGSTPAFLFKADGSSYFAESLAVGRTGQISIAGSSSSSVFEQLSDTDYPLCLHSSYGNKRGLGIFYADTGAGNSGDPYILCTNNTGVKFQVASSGAVTANSFVGDGSGLTNLPGSSTNDLQDVTSNGSTTTTGASFGSGGFVVESDGDISTNIRGHGHIELDSSGSFSSPKIKLFANTGAANFIGRVTAGELTVTGTIESVGTANRGARLGNVQVGYDTKYNTVQIDSGTSDLYLQYNATGGVNFNYGNSGSVTVGSALNTVWHAGNDGSGSGLDADTVDGLQATKFLRADATNTITASGDQKLILSGSTSPYIRYQSGTTDKHYTQSHSSGFYIWDSTSNRGLRLTGTTPQWYDTAAYQTIWHAGNDGTGSGLDADTIDGVQGYKLFSSYNNGQGGWEDSNANFLVRSGSTAVGLCMENSSGTFGFQLYASGSTYGFLTGNWGSWDIKKTVNGQMALRVSGTDYNVWHTGNDGAGSGLDADSLDGYTWDTNGKNVRATEFYADSWFRNYDSGDGLYNQATGAHFYSDADQTWNLTGDTENQAVNLKFRGTYNGDIEGWIHADGSGRLGNLSSTGNWATWSYISQGYSPNLWFSETSGESWSGNPGNGQAKIEYHSNQFYIAAGNDSSNIVRFRRYNNDVASIDNNGIFSTSGGLSVTGGVINSTTSAALFLEHNGSNIDPYLRMQTSGTTNGYLQFTTTDAYLWNSRASQGFRIGASNGLEYYSSGYNKVWHAGNDGSGSGLDADLLDGLQGSVYLNKGSSSSYYQPDNWIDFNTTNVGLYWAGSSSAGWHIYPHNATNMRFRTAGTSCGLMVQTDNGTTRGVLYGDNSNNIGLLNQNGNWRLKCPSSGSLSRDGTQTIWDAGNDGSGSGLDADTVDGIQGSTILRSGVNNDMAIINKGYYTTATSSQNQNSGAIHYGWGYQESGSWSHPYPDVVFGYHTGMKFGGYTGYGGCRFYADHPSNSSSILFSVGNGNNNVHVSSNLTCGLNITAYSSDRRLKKNFKNIESAVDKVSKLNGCSFDWIDNIEELGFTPDFAKNDVGLIAQEVEAVLPQAVAPAPFDHECDIYAEDPEDRKYKSKSGENYLTVRYERLVPLLVEAIKELKAEIDTLKGEKN